MKWWESRFSLYNLASLNIREESWPTVLAPIFYSIYISWIALIRAIKNTKQLGLLRERAWIKQFSSCLFKASSCKFWQHFNWDGWSWLFFLPLLEQACLNCFLNRASFISKLGLAWTKQIWQHFNLIFKLAGTYCFVCLHCNSKRLK